MGIEGYLRLRDVDPFPHVEIEREMALVVPSNLIHKNIFVQALSIVEHNSDCDDRS